MYFKNEDDLLLKIKSLKEIGFGAQGICYLDKNTSLVYKIYNGFFDGYKLHCNYVDIMKFSNIKNNTYIFPKDVIWVNDRIAGYIEHYVNSKDLFNINPFRVSLDKLIYNISKVKNDIEIISENGVLTYDVMYNIIYKNKFNIIDTDEYVVKDIDPSLLMERNNYNFDYAIYNFLVDNIFDDFVNSYKILRNMYKFKDIDVIVFIELLRKYLSEYLGFEVNKLGDAKVCINKVKTKIPNYIRDIEL